MFPKMRRSEKQLSNERAFELLDEGEYGVLSMFGPEEYPYGVPLNYSRVKNKLYFHGAKKGSKNLFLEKNPKVCFTVTTQCDLVPEQFETYYTSVIVFGRIEEVLDEKEKTDALYSLIVKYSKDYLEEGKEYIKRSGKATKVFQMYIDHMTAKLGR
ncbi:MAG: pyridoxamine 5'-phosphate oxidase family protein [Tissierellia bacterium]|nr:pyridoxamine 5'-phosphate oxidase family protein [Tissierellia bacterium]